MVTLPQIDGLHFKEDIHRYFREGHGWLAHSVTGVTQDLSPFAKAKIESTKAIWEPRGNACHAALERFLLTGERTENTGYDAIIQPLLSYPLWDGCEVLACEYRLCDKSGRKSLGGSFDFLVRTRKGKLVLGDLKTVGSTPAVTSRKPATAQLGAYCALLLDWHPRLLIDKCVTVVAGPHRTHAISQEPDECLSAWVDAWDAFQLLQPNF